MPSRSEPVEPEILLTHRGVPVYRTYRDDNVEEGLRTFWFTLDPFYGTDSGAEFDVRTLPTWQPPEHPPFLSGEMTEQERADREAAWERYRADNTEEKAIHAAITRALGSGHLDPYRCPLSWCKALVPNCRLEPGNICPVCHRGPSTLWIPSPSTTSHSPRQVTLAITCSLQAASEEEAITVLTTAIRAAIPTVTFLPPTPQEPSHVAAA